MASGSPRSSGNRYSACFNALTDRNFTRALGSVWPLSVRPSNAWEAVWALNPNQAKAAAFGSSCGARPSHFPSDQSDLSDSSDRSDPAHGLCKRYSPGPLPDGTFKTDISPDVTTLLVTAVQPDGSAAVVSSPKPKPEVNQKTLA